MTVCLTIICQKNQGAVMWKRKGVREQSPLQRMASLRYMLKGMDNRRRVAESPERH